MVRFSNIIGIRNFATFLLSIPILVGGIWLVRRADTDCEKFLQWPFIAIGGFLMLVSLAGLVVACCRVTCLLWLPHARLPGFLVLVSLAGLVGAFCRVTWLLWLYLAVMFILILLLFSFTVFALVVTNQGTGKAVGNRGYKEYMLGDYSNWLQKCVEKSSNWNKIRSCLQDAKVCKSLADHSVKEVAEQFYKNNLSPTQSDCCKPPTSCNFVYVNATVWTPPTTNSTSTDTDCIHLE